MNEESVIHYEWFKNAESGTDLNWRDIRESSPSQFKYACGFMLSNETVSWKVVFLITVKIIS